MGIETIIAGVTAASAAKSAFGGGSKGGGSTTTQTVDPAMMAIYNDVYSKSQGLANQPYLPYTGPRVAGFNPDELRGFGATRNMFGTSMGADNTTYVDPRTRINTLMNSSAPTFLSANATPETGIGQYMNPYTTNVVDTNIADLDRARQIALNSNADSAIAANAFGGSRQGVLEAETNRNFADAVARSSAGLRAEGYKDAMNTLQSDLDRQNNIMPQQALFGSYLLNDQQKQLANLQNIGLQQRQFQQKTLDQAYNQFANAQQYPQNQLSVLTQGAGLFPNTINSQVQDNLSSTDKLASYATGINELKNLYDTIF